ncbi:MAG: hypothetical protein A2Z20_07255 [Bdellovibrionales bacterium RBG_16_40_8]|nr:MAG: hypothetical protein A2Z20_07255 [Bdellovibrionales bacterium RBG_16_40_8]
MDPKILQFLYFNGLVVLLLIVYFIWRPKRAPSRLKLRETQPRDKLQPLPDFKNAPEAANRHERRLNVIFQFNGHDFDAYEVLGIAAGSSLEQVEKTYTEVITSCEEDSHEFFRMAYEAIRKN